jgi:hypothetical protein
MLSPKHIHASTQRKADMNTTAHTNTTPATRNEAWGFFGAMGQPPAIEAISKATGESHETVRHFLDAVPGRHLADNVHNAMFGGLALADTIEAATHKWMRWSISLAASRRYGIPRGLPYLTGFVIHCDQLSNDE